MSEKIRKGTKTVYHYLKARDALDDIEHSRLKMSLIGKLNDPNELQAVVFKGTSQAVNQELVAKFTRNWGMVCFSDERNNAICWERYGEAGQGICLAFKIKLQNIEKVNYVDKVEEITFPEHLLEEWRSEGKLTDKLVQALHPYVICKDATKLKDHHRWQDEKEWRSFAKLDCDSVTKERLFFSDDWHENRLKLKSVILGPSCSTSVAEVRAALASYYRKHPSSGEVKMERHSNRWI